MLAQQLNANLSTSGHCVDIDTWLNEDANDPGYQLLSDEDIIEQVTATNEESDNDDDNEGSSGVPSNGEVADMLDKCLLW